MDNQEILIKVKDNLKISWEDDQTNRELLDYIESARKYLLNLSGVELTFARGSSEIELLVERVRYRYNNALDEFEKNFASEIAAFILDMAVQNHLEEVESYGSD